MDTPTTAPDWRALVAECGAPNANMLTGAATLAYAACEIHAAGIGYVAIAQPSGAALWRALVRGNRAKSIHQSSDPRGAIRAALDYLRAELRARIERDAAALARLGGGE